MTIHVDAIMYYKVSDATSCIANVDDYGQSTRLLAATTLRNVLGTKTLGEILSERDSIANDMQTTLDEATEPWGVKVERVEVKDVRLPKNLQRAMAAEAEATREAQAKVIAAEGEHKASRSLRHAADVLGDNQSAMQVCIYCNIYKFVYIDVSAPLFAHFECNISREEQHHCFSHPSGYYFTFDAVKVLTN